MAVDASGRPGVRTAPAAVARCGLTPAWGDQRFVKTQSFARACMWQDEQRAPFARTP
jgi:hypothetical protein